MATSNKFVVGVTGLSGSRKTTLCKDLHDELIRRWVGYIPLDIIACKILYSELFFPGPVYQKCRQNASELFNMPFGYNGAYEKVKKVFYDLGTNIEERVSLLTKLNHITKPAINDYLSLVTTGKEYDIILIDGVMFDFFKIPKYCDVIISLDVVNQKEDLVKRENITDDKIQVRNAIQKEDLHLMNMRLTRPVIKMRYRDGNDLHTLIKLLNWEMKN